MQLHELQRNTTLKKKRRIGRGGNTGKTSGRGTKGQKARAGHKIRPEIRDQIKKVPKKRGYRFNSIKNKPAVVNVAQLSSVYEDGAIVTPTSLLELGLIKRVGGKAPVVKILGFGQLTKKNLTIKDCLLSKTATDIVAKAGGKIEAN